MRKLLVFFVIVTVSGLLFPSMALSQSLGKAIIVAGSGPYPGNLLWDATQQCTNFAYSVLTYQGFTDDDIYYLSSDTALQRVDGDATLTNLQSAITQWAVNEGADSLVLYFTGHGGSDVFRMNETEILSSAVLANWLEHFQANSPDQTKIIAIYDAAESGSFLNELQGSNRIIITSAQLGEPAMFSNQGTISFSHFFWSNISNGLSVSEAFIHASQAINLVFSDQNPQISGEAVNVYFGNITTTTTVPSTTTTIVSPFVETYNFEQMWPTLMQPWYFYSLSSIALDSSENVYIVDSNTARILKFTSTGYFLTTWGTVGTGAGEFMRPKGIAIDHAGYVYVADTGNHRIQKFDLNGTFITQLGSYGSGYGEFNSPEGIAIDDAGNVFIADTMNNRIQKFTRYGDIIILGDDNDPPLSPIDIALDSIGNVYVTDQANNRIWLSVILQ